MKINKKLTALLLSVALLAGTAVPSFAEPESDTAENAATTTQTTDTTTPEQSGIDSTDANAQQDDADAGTDTANTEDGADTSADGTDAAAPAEDAAAQEEPENQTSSTDADGNVRMPTITVDAEASILVNAETGEIVHADNEKEKKYPASCTKIMTALLALEKCSLDTVVTMQEEDFVDVNNGASNAGLKVGEEITVENLLYCLMLPSGNESDM